MSETLGKGHGRIEQRRLTCTDDLDDDLTWPGVQQVLRRECERQIVKTGQVSRSVSYALTSLPATAASNANSNSGGADTGRSKTACIMYGT